MTIGRNTDEFERTERGRVATAERPQPSVHAREEDVVTTQRGGGSLARGMIRLLALPIAYALALVETVLGFRLAFLLAGANPTNDFVDFVYDAGDPLAEPFQGIIANKTVDSGIFEQVNPGLFEPATTIAMAVCMAIGLVVIGLILMLTRTPSTGKIVESRNSRQRAAYEH